MMCKYFLNILFVHERIASRNDLFRDAVVLLQRLLLNKDVARR